MFNSNYLQLSLSPSLLFSSIILFLITDAAPSFENRIINGFIAHKHQFPWHVSIIGLDELRAKQLCGGSLIDREWVVTAAHCVLKRKSLILGFGSKILTEPLFAYENVTEYYIHPDYDTKLKHHDIALIKLPAPITENEFIKTIALPKSGDNVTYNLTLGQVAGFGRYIKSSIIISRALRWTFVQVIANEECQRVYGDGVITPSTMCAISIHSSNRNTCSGDSGGSLAVIENNRYILAGITSFIVNEECGEKYPSGFMRIRPHLKWIYDQMNKHRI